jgi:hypothetical protein
MMTPETLARESERQIAVAELDGYHFTRQESRAFT